ncbi:MAG: LacI family transcriptional regulator [Armatimonadota bacterium]|nr:LacI family transcriptional regulator [Armatimonadota bacterium]
MSSIYEVARQAGVSAATVSRTFRTPDKLSQETRRHVLDVAARLNYTPRRHTPEAGTGAGAVETAQSVGFFFFTADSDSGRLNDFYAPVMMGAQAEASQAGMTLTLRTASRYEGPAEPIPSFRAQEVAGALLVGAALPDVLAAYDAPGLPAVLVDNRDETGRRDCILSDGFGGAGAATRSLLELGHRRIAFVQDEATAPSFRDRRNGYLCALWEAGIIPQAPWVVSTPRRVPLEPFVQALRALPEPPTAIVAANDVIGFGLLTACRALGLCVPQDVSIVGFDDTAFSVHAYPALTTVRVDKEQMGRLAVRQLLTRIAEAQSEAGQLPAAHLIVPVSLVERDSCAPPPSP